LTGRCRRGGGSLAWLDAGGGGLGRERPAEGGGFSRLHRPPSRNDGRPTPCHPERLENLRRALDLAQNGRSRARGDFGINFVGRDFKKRFVAAALLSARAFLSHLVMVPSKMDSPIWGMTIIGWHVRPSAELREVSGCGNRSLYNEVGAEDVRPGPTARVL